MQDCFEATGDICWKDPHARAVWREYETSCRDALTEYGELIRGIFDGDGYKDFRSERAGELSEKIKTLSRFFVTDLGRLLPTAMLGPSEIHEYRTDYQNNLLKLVPMLTSIPGYRDGFDAVCEQLPPFSAAFDHLISLIGPTPDAIKLKRKARLSSAQPVLPVVEIDPLELPLSELAGFLDCQFDEHVSATEKLETMNRRVRETIASLKEDLERATKRLSILEPLNSKEVIQDRFQQICQFKREIAKVNQLEKDRFMRDTIFQVRMPINAAVDVSASHPNQLRSVVAQVSYVLASQTAEIVGLNQDLESWKALLGQFVESGPPNSMAQAACKVVRESRSPVGAFEAMPGSMFGEPASPLNKATTE
jgi:hypothetical protein